MSPGMLLRVILSALTAWRPEQELLSFTSKLIARGEAVAMFLLSRSPPGGGVEA